MNKKSLLLITLFAFTIILSVTIFSRTIKSKAESLSNNLNYNEKDDNPMGLKTNYNNNNNKENLVKQNRDISKDQSNKSTSKDKVNVDNSINTNNKLNTKDKNTDNNIQKQSINIQNYLDKLSCINYELRQGETLTDIARRYENNCNLNTTIKVIKSINKIENENDIDAKTILSIPESTIQNGTMYKIIPGDTWYKIANKYDSKYDVDSIMNLIVYVNNLPNNDLPLGEKIFLPVI